MESITWWKKNNFHYHCKHRHIYTDVKKCNALFVRINVLLVELCDFVPCSTDTPTVPENSASPGHWVSKQRHPEYRTQPSHRCRNGTYRYRHHRGVRGTARTAGPGQKQSELGFLTRWCYICHFFLLMFWCGQLFNLLLILSLCVLVLLVGEYWRKSQSKSKNPSLHVSTVGSFLVAKCWHLYEEIKHLLVLCQYDKCLIWRSLKSPLFNTSVNTFLCVWLFLHNFEDKITLL